MRFFASRLRKSHAFVAFIAFVALFSAAAVTAHAQSVALAGILGSKALLVVDGGAPRSMAAGQTHQGVRVVSVSKGEVVVEMDGTRHTLRLGETPVNMGAAAALPRLVLKADPRGHFVSNGQINGKAMQYMVDTGATTVVISQAEANRLGLKMDQALPVRMSTANGMVDGSRLRLDSVRIGPLELRGVESTITPQPMPYVLLGNSFLNAFEMNRSGDSMTLKKK